MAKYVRGQKYAFHFHFVIKNRQQFVGALYTYKWVSLNGFITSIHASFDSLLKSRTNELRKTHLATISRVRHVRTLSNGA